MKIVLPGGSGQVGRLLAREFHADGHEVVVLSRQPVVAPWRTVQWDAKNDGPWASEFEGADAIINLTGRSVNCRYTAANRHEIIASRVESVHAVGRAIQKAKVPPKVWLQAGTATIYSHRYDAPNDEITGQLDPAAPDAPDTWRFSIDVARRWEAALEPFAALPVRRVMLRISLVMSPDRGGVYDVMLGLAKRGLGGRMGDGRQFVSWIHGEDFYRAVRWLIPRDDFSGPVNLAAPHPLPNAEFMRLLREAAGARWGLPAEKWMLEIGALFMRTETELILKSRRVVPGRLLAAGFEFKHPTWAEAARALQQRWRTERNRS